MLVKVITWPQAVNQMHSGIATKVMYYDGEDNVWSLHRGKIQRSSMLGLYAPSYVSPGALDHGFRVEEYSCKRVD